MDSADSTITIGGGGGGDRLSQLDDATLGHILSFLPADEAARAAALSRRWRHVFAHVHTVSLDKPAPAPDWDADEGYRSLTPEYRLCRECAIWGRVRPFVNRVSAALLGRLRLPLPRRGGGAAAAGVPLRAFRVGFDNDESSSPQNAAVMDMWLWHAVQQAGDELHLDLRLSHYNDEHADVCGRIYSLGREPPPPPPVAGAETTTIPLAAAAARDDEDDGVPDSYVTATAAAPMDGYVSSPMDEDPADGYVAAPMNYAAAAGAFRGYDDADVCCYVVPRTIFRCAALRTLRLGSCRLDVPPDAALPSLEALHLTAVAGAVERLVSSCPRLAALTLEACAAVTALTVPPCVRLRALALRCCHGLAAVAVADASELRAFEYRGGVPGPSFLTLHGGGGPLTVSSCTLDFCGYEVLEPSGLEDMLRLFAGVERLQLTSARLGCRAVVLSPHLLPTFAKLRHLELTGMLPEDDATAVDAVARILERTPNLETLSLFFMPDPKPGLENNHYGYGYGYGEDALHRHNLKYDERASLAMPDIDLHCLRERVKEINLVHYQGGMAQRMLAKFLLCNAPGVQEVCGEFASGPLFIQIKLMEEIKGWVMNRSANMMFF